MSQPDMESIFTKIIYEIFWSQETIMWIFEIIKIKCFYPPRILDEHWCIYSCLQIPPRENWFQYVRRVYATAINFPCISTLLPNKFCRINKVSTVENSACKIWQRGEQNNKSTGSCNTLEFPSRVNLSGPSLYCTAWTLHWVNEADTQ